MKRLLLFLLAVCAGATTLTGTLNNPDGTGATGQIRLSLSQPGALSPAGGCGGPIEIVPSQEVTVNVLNGALVAPPSIYGNDCILPQNTYYNVRFLDNRGNIIFTDRWIISGASINIGTIVSVVVSGLTTTLGSVGLVFTTPTGDQTINQPAGSFLHVNNLDVTTKLTGPGGMNCLNNLGQCSYSVPVAFVGGLGTSPLSSSEIYIGNVGNLFLRTFPTLATCTGVQDGAIGVQTSPPISITMCIGNVIYRAPLVTP
jgi:hypothetical protein